MVTDVIDGDTLRVRRDGMEVRVRLIGIDVPEAVACFGVAATARLRALAPPGTVVGLERDVSETDRYGRLLCYVWLPDGRMLNEVLVREGVAQAVTFPPDVRYQDRLLQAQAEGAGLWSACGPTPTPSGAAARPGGRCDPSYPDVCIPPPPPDLDCRDIPYRRFRVLPPDPHRLDGDGDGIGCER